MNVIILPDGYNGHVVECWTTPIEVKDGVAKLPVVRSSYLFALCPVEKLEGGVSLVGMSDQQFAAITNAAVDIQYLIVTGGGMATKTAVEDALMARFGLDRADAHTVTNFVESRRDFTVGSSGVLWQAQRPEPQRADYPELLA